MVGSSVGACVFWDRGCWNRLRRARKSREIIDCESGRVFFRGGLCPLGSRNREKILSVIVIGSFVAACIACVIVTAVIAAER
jgi:hypothetical protein